MLAVNAAWRRFADENGLALPEAALGASYLSECDAAAANGCADAEAVAAAIRALAAAEREDFRIEYACHGAQRPRWFQLRITRFGRGGATRLVFAHEEVTELKQSEERLHELTGQILHVQDRERRRIARELHDGVAQQVFAMSLEIARARAGGEGAEVARSLDECEALCRTVLQDLRTVSHLLHPPLLDVTGLVPALDWYVRGFAKRSGIDVRFRSEGVERLETETELALFRVVQEALANVQRHSESPSAQVSLAQANGEVVLVIADQGKGIQLGPESLVGVGVGGCASGSGSSAGRCGSRAGRRERRSGRSCRRGCRLRWSDDGGLAAGTGRRDSPYERPRDQSPFTACSPSSSRALRRGLDRVHERGAEAAQLERVHARDRGAARARHLILEPARGARRSR